MESELYVSPTLAGRGLQANAQQPAPQLSFTLCSCMHLVCVCVLCRVIWAWNRDDTKVLDIPYPKPSSSRSQTGPQCCLTEMFLSPSMSFGWEVLVCFLAAGHDRG